MTTPPSRLLRIATRGSRLAVWQAEHVAALIRGAVPGQAVELVHISTLGDRDQSGSLRGFGQLGVFTREVQNAVLDGRADIAVHSLKDLPTDTAPGFQLAAVPKRGAMLDALILPRKSNINVEVDNPALQAKAWIPTALPQGARVGTESLRRRAQLAHWRPDLRFEGVRGNVETRVRKLDEGEFDALVLAVAGLTRLQMRERISVTLGPPVMYPAVGQGAIGIECRADDADAAAVLARIVDRDTLSAVTAERALLASLRAGCHAPLGIWTTCGEPGWLRLEAVVLSPDGCQRLQADRCGSAVDAAALGEAVAADLREQGAEAVMAAGIAVGN